MLSCRFVSAAVLCLSASISCQCLAVSYEQDANGRLYYVNKWGEHVYVGANNNKVRTTQRNSEVKLSQSKASSQRSSDFQIVDQEGQNFHDSDGPPRNRIRIDGPRGDSAAAVNNPNANVRVNADLGGTTTVSDPQFRSANVTRFNSDAQEKAYAALRQDPLTSNKELNVHLDPNTPVISRRTSRLTGGQVGNLQLRSYFNDALRSQNVYVDVRTGNLYQAKGLYGADGTDSPGISANSKPIGRVVNYGFGERNGNEVPLIEFADPNHPARKAAGGRQLYFDTNGHIYADSGADKKDGKSHLVDVGGYSPVSGKYYIRQESLASLDKNKPNRQITSEEPKPTAQPLIYDSPQLAGGPQGTAGTIN